MTTKKKLLQIKGISEAKVDKIKEAIQKIVVKNNIIFDDKYQIFLKEILARILIGGFSGLVKFLL